MVAGNVDTRNPASIGGTGLLGDIVLVGGMDLYYGNVPFGGTDHN